MNRAIAIAAVVLASWLTAAGVGSASGGSSSDPQIFKGKMDPWGTIRFQARESKRVKAPHLDRFQLSFDCNDGLGPTGQGYGAKAGSPVQPNAKGKFRILAEYSDLTFDLKGDFNRRYTKASGTFRFQGNVGDGVHTNCDTGLLRWQAELRR
jgi:hypothetical protein